MLRDLPWIGAPLAALDARLHRRQDGRVIIYYDGECGICNRLVALVLKAGVPGDFYFASQSSDTWKVLLAAKPHLQRVDSVVVLTEEDGKQQLRLRSEAVLWAMTQLRLPYALGWCFLWVPRPLRDLGYVVVARLRKWLSARLAPTCPVPPAAFSDRFLR